MDIIKTFAEIERTGVLPPSFHWKHLVWDVKNGWRGYCGGPQGASRWISAEMYMRSWKYESEIE